MSGTPEWREYLLGRMPAREIARGSQEAFELEIAESALIDDYAAGNLTTKDRADFETHFLTTAERRQSLGLAKSILRHQSRRNLWRRAGIVAAVAAALALLIYVPRMAGGGRDTLVLSPGMERGGEKLPTLVLRPSAEIAVLELQLPEIAGEVETQIVRVGEADAVLTTRISLRGAKALRVPVHAGTLTAGDYRVTLLAGDQIRLDYSFRVGR